MGTEKKENKQTSSGQISEKVEEGLETLPNMEVSRLLHLLKCGSENATATKAKLLTIVEKDDMAPFYEKLCQDEGWTVDSQLLAKMKSQNAKEIEQCGDKLKDATENLGDIEVLDALFAKAVLYSRIGDRIAAIAAFKEANEKPQSINQKILVSLHLIRIGLFFSDVLMVQENIRIARQFIDEGGDWDRRNRLKVYEGCFMLMARDFKKASILFQDSVATFTSEELMSYSNMVFYCILTSVLETPRVDLKKKIVDSPEILAVLNDLPYCSEFLNGLYDCKYKQFFVAIVGLYEAIQQDKYLSMHSRYIYRELRVLAYSQFLEAYRSVKMESMAASFGISEVFLDSELSRFIAAGRLNAKIDKVGGVVETNRPDLKNTLYQSTIKKGDHLLNRLQKLARVINI